jgi:transposase InsO family protein
MRARGFRVESICRVLCEHGVQVVEYATMEWVDGFNNRRLHSLLDYVPPEEYETASTLNSGRPSGRVSNMKPA